MKNVNIEHKKDFKAPSKLPPVTDADFTEKFKLYYDNIIRLKTPKKPFNKIKKRSIQNFSIQ